MSLMQKDRGQQGFTLIEIISVLVISDILAAVPFKYYDFAEREAQKPKLQWPLLPKCRPV